MGLTRWSTFLSSSLNYRRLSTVDNHTTAMPPSPIATPSTKAKCAGEGGSIGRPAFQSDWNLCLSGSGVDRNGAELGVCGAAVGGGLVAIEGVDPALTRILAAPKVLLGVAVQAARRGRAQLLCHIAILV